MVGLGMGLEGSLHSLFVVELMSEQFRGPFVTSGVVTITLGILVIYLIGSFLQWHVWKLGWVYFFRKNFCRT